MKPTGYYSKCEIQARQRAERRQAYINGAKLIAFIAVVLSAAAFIVKSGVF